MNQPSPSTREDWRARAGCLGADPDLFGERWRDDQNEAYRIAAAKARCAACPVVAECFDWAASFGDAYGIFGGEMFTNGKVHNRRIVTDTPPPPVLLSDQRVRLERVAELVRGGWTNDSIIAELHISDRAVTQVRARITGRVAA